MDHARDAKAWRQRTPQRVSCLPTPCGASDSDPSPTSLRAVASYGGLGGVHLRMYLHTRFWSALLADLGHIDAVGQERGLSPLPVLRVSDGQSSGSTHAVPETSADASDGVARSEAGTGYRRQTAPRCSAKLSSESERTALAFVT